MSECSGGRFRPAVFDGGFESEYRARLRRDFIEILVGASEPAKAEKPAAPAKDKSKSKPAAKAHAK